MLLIGVSVVGVSPGALTPFEDLWICLKFGQGSVGVGDCKLVWVWDSFSFLESSASRVVFLVVPGGGMWWVLCSSLNCSMV